MRFRLLAVCGLLVLAAVVPLLGAIVCGATLLVQVALICIRPIIARLPSSAFHERETILPPVFSIHVATYSEPPDLVIRTLRTLLGQDWPLNQYEIIVMDNNTSDETLWRPVEAFCARHPGRLKFIHQADVQGAKAGALNIALEHTRPDASHIITVDADYIAEPGFLTAAAVALARTGADYVQFPQSYLGASGIAAGVDAELEEYFRSNAAVADGAEAVLLTGTLCVISRDALIAAGGWSGTTTTEDAEMGVRLCGAGFTGRFIDQIVGQGLLPFSLNDLEKQRYRWCSGNLQTLLRHFRTILTPNGSLSLHKRLVVVSQLTAWFNLALAPAVLLLAALFLEGDHSVVAVLAASVIVLSLIDVVFRLFGRGFRDGLGLRVMSRALACRVALAPQSAKATFDAILGKELKFVVTNKSGANAPSSALVPTCHLMLFIVALLVLIGAQPANPLVIAALLILMLPMPAAMLTDNSLRAYRRTILTSHMEARA